MKTVKIIIDLKNLDRKIEYDTGLDLNDWKIKSEFFKERIRQDALWENISIVEKYNGEEL